jgi:hypothetical protein
MIDRPFSAWLMDGPDNPNQTCARRWWFFSLGPPLLWKICTRRYQHTKNVQQATCGWNKPMASSQIMVTHPNENVSLVYIIVTRHLIVFCTSIQSKIRERRMDDVIYWRKKMRKEEAWRKIKSLFFCSERSCDDLPADHSNPDRKKQHSLERLQ